MSRFGVFATQPFVPVDSRTRNRAPRQQVDVPEVGLRWGRPAIFEFDLPAEDEAARDGGGVTIRWPARYVETERVNIFTPVWRRYEVVRVRSDADPTIHVDVGVTREALIPIGEATLRHVGGGIGYVEDPGSHGYTERVIHSFVLLSIPSPFTDGEIIDEGTVGEWPDYPEDPFSAGSILAGIGGTPHGSGSAWDR